MKKKYLRDSYTLDQIIPMIQLNPSFYQKDVCKFQGLRNGKQHVKQTKSAFEAETGKPKPWLAWALLWVPFPQSSGIPNETLHLQVLTSGRQ